ncbi:MAG: hypothetical protein CVV03_04845 [Firmicutes bacterium HGW-Firmicutes-8]|nr:MAG: hypothetical protein CVV03_04845 [Firmicutes bacterium HGW-Firmicutes-8]
MSWITPSIAATLTGTFFLTVVYWYIYTQYREKFMAIWAISWLIYTARLVFELSMQFVPDMRVLLVAQQLTSLISGVLLFWGTTIFVGRSMSRWMVYLAALDGMWITFGIFTGLTRIWLNLPTFVFIGLIFIWSGIVFLRSKEIGGLGQKFTGWAFILWGIHKGNYPFIGQISWLVPWGYWFAALLEFMVAFGALNVYFEKMKRHLVASEERFRLLAENAHDLIYRYRFLPDPGFEYVSPSVVSVLGYTPEEVYADPNSIYKVALPEDHHRLLPSTLANESSDETYIFQWRRKDEKMIWVENRIVFMKDGDGKVTAMEGIARDITERKMAEDALKRYRLLSEHAGDIILFLRQDGQIIDVNDAAVKVYGYNRKELLGMSAYDLRAPETKSSLAENLLQAELMGILFETYHQRKDGSVFPVEISLQSTMFGDERVLFGIVRDISERKKAEETINHLAYHDPLTDLPNRILFYDRLNMALAHARRNRQMVAVMFLDLDRFKYVNDMMGHAMGDHLLKDVASQLAKCVRSDDTVARIGGDEFTILLPEIGREEDAAKVAKKINEVLKKPWVINNHEFQITASIGIVLYPNDGEDAETLTKNADTAMYRAKEQGDNYQFYTPAMNAKSIERLEMEQSLRKALEQNEFEVYYQPLVDIRAGRIIGVEALVRWHHPERGLILPLEFISLAEDTGQIIQIGEWVLLTACEQNKEWQDAGFPPLRVAVNLSACQFRQKDLVETVSKVLMETGVDPHLLELEITESTAMQDVELTISVLKSLREMGVRIAIDDFGTGYSSLSYLRRFPITTLKVDRSFVRDVLADVEDAAIVATIIVLANNLKLKVIVEGVETEEQLAFFEQQECFEMQGFLFSKPESADKIGKLLKRYMAQTRKALRSV